MPEAERARLDALLAELCSAVGADGGCALYVADGDSGVLSLAASAGQGQGSAPRFLQRLRGGGATNAETTQLVLSLPAETPSVVVLWRRGDADFTQQDTTVARLFLSRLADVSQGLTNRAQRSGWTHQLETIQRIAARLTRLASVEEVAATICTATRQVISYDEAQVLVTTGPDGTLRVVAAAGAPVVNGRALPLPSTGPAGAAIARAAVRGVPVLAANLPEPGHGREGPISLLAVPLHFEGRVSGVICLISRDPATFDDDDLRLLQILSDQAAVAIENARLLAGRDQLVQELGALLDVSEAAGRAADEVELAAVLAEQMRRATRTDAVIVSRWEEGTTVLSRLWSDGVPAGNMPMDVADSPLRRNVLRHGRPAVVHVDTTDPLPEAVLLHALGGQTLISVPLHAGGRTIGIVDLISITERRVLDPSVMQTMETMASLGGTGLQKVGLLEQLRKAADMDLVTGVHNHRYLQERLRQEVARSARSHSPLAVLMLDLDKFKPVNDSHGHADGDRVLRNIGAAIKAHVRTSDVVARYGGDEFVVLMPDTPQDQAEIVARRVVAGVLDGRHTMTDGAEVSVGISAGLAIYPNDGLTSAQLLQVADAQMYAAKRSGGQQVERSADLPIAVEAAPSPVAV